MTANKITMYRGDTNIITVSVIDAEGNTFDLTGYDMRLTVKNKSTDDDSKALIQKTGVIADPTTGIGLINITSSDSDLDQKDYVYDVQITNPITEDNKTVIKDVFAIIDDVTKTTS